MPLRIAVITETYPPEVNGVAKTISRLVAGALKRGNSIELIRPSQPSDVQAKLTGNSRQGNGKGSPGSYEQTRFTEILVPGVPIPGYSDMRLGLPVRARLLRQWRIRRPDVVQIVTEGPLGYVASSAARELNIPVVSEFHTNFDAYSRHYFGYSLLKNVISGYLRLLHNRSRLTLAPTRATANQLRSSGYKNVSVVARGVDTGLYRPSCRRETLRQNWGAKSDDLVVIYVGRIAAEKNLALVFKAFATIAKRIPAAKLVIVGDGPMRKDLASKHKSCVFTGIRLGEELAEHYASADMFLFPSLTETFGNVVTESLASGLPLVAYRCAAAAELVISGSNGMVVSPGNERKYVKAAVQLAEVLKISANRDAFREAARASVEHLSWDSIFQQMDDVFHRVIEDAVSTESAVALPAWRRPLLGTVLRLGGNRP